MEMNLDINDDNVGDGAMSSNTPSSTVPSGHHDLQSVSNNLTPVLNTTTSIGVKCSIDNKSKSILKTEQNAPAKINPSAITETSQAADNRTAIRTLRPIDLSKLKQSGLDRKIAEILSKQKQNQQIKRLTKEAKHVSDTVKPSSLNSPQKLYKILKPIPTLATANPSACATAPQGSMKASTSPSDLSSFRTIARQNATAELLSTPSASPSPAASPPVQTPSLSSPINVSKTSPSKNIVPPKITVTAPDPCNEAEKSELVDLTPNQRLHHVKGLLQQKLLQRQHQDCVTNNEEKRLFVNLKPPQAIPKAVIKIKAGDNIPRKKVAKLRPQSDENYRVKSMTAAAQSQLKLMKTLASSSASELLCNKPKGKIVVIKKESSISDTTKPFSGHHMFKVAEQAPVLDRQCSLKEHWYSTPDNKLPIKQKTPQKLPQDIARKLEFQSDDHAINSAQYTCNDINTSTENYIDYNTTKCLGVAQNTSITYAGASNISCCSPMSMTKQRCVMPDVSPLKKPFPTANIPQETPLPTIDTFKKPYPMPVSNYFTMLSHTSPQNYIYSTATANYQIPQNSLQIRPSSYISQNNYNFNPLAEGNIAPNSLIVLENKVLSHDEMIDLTALRLSNTPLSFSKPHKPIVEIKQETQDESLFTQSNSSDVTRTPETSKIVKDNAPNQANANVKQLAVKDKNILNAKNLPTHMVMFSSAHTTKYIINAQKLKLPPEQIADLAKHIAKRTEADRKIQAAGLVFNASKVAVSKPSYSCKIEGNENSSNIVRANADRNYNENYIQNSNPLSLVAQKDNNLSKKLAIPPNIQSVPTNFILKNTTIVSPRKKSGNSENSKIVLFVKEQNPNDTKNTVILPKCLVNIKETSHPPLKPLLHSDHNENEKICNTLPLLHKPAVSKRRQPAVEILDEADAMESFSAVDFLASLDCSQQLADENAQLQLTADEVKLNNSCNMSFSPVRIQNFLPRQRDVSSICSSTSQEQRTPTRDSTSPLKNIRVSNQTYSIDRVADENNSLIVSDHANETLTAQISTAVVHDLLRKKVHVPLDIPKASIKTITPVSMQNDSESDSDIIPPKINALSKSMKATTCTRNISKEPLVDTVIIKSSNGCDHHLPISFDDDSPKISDKITLTKENFKTIYKETLLKVKEKHSTDKATKTRTSSETIVKDIAGKYLLVKTPKKRTSSETIAKDCLKKDSLDACPKKRTTSECIGKNPERKIIINSSEMSHLKGKIPKDTNNIENIRKEFFENTTVEGEIIKTGLTVAEDNEIRLKGADLISPKEVYDTIHEKYTEQETQLLTDNRKCMGKLEISNRNTLKSDTPPQETTTIEDKNKKYDVPIIKVPETSISLKSILKPSQAVDYIEQVYKNSEDIAKSSDASSLPKPDVNTSSPPANKRISRFKKGKINLVQRNKPSSATLEVKQSVNSAPTSNEKKSVNEEAISTKSLVPAQVNTSLASQSNEVTQEIAKLHEQIKIPIQNINITEHKTVVGMMTDESDKNISTTKETFLECTLKKNETKLSADSNIEGTLCSILLSEQDKEDHQSKKKILIDTETSKIDPESSEDAINSEMLRGHNFSSPTADKHVDLPSMLTTKEPQIINVEVVVALPQQQNNSLEVSCDQVNKNLKSDDVNFFEPENERIVKEQQHKNIVLSNADSNSSNTIKSSEKCSEESECAVKTTFDKNEMEQQENYWNTNKTESNDDLKKTPPTTNNVKRLSITLVDIVKNPPPELSSKPPQLPFKRKHNDVSPPIAALPEPKGIKNILNQIMAHKKEGKETVTNRLSEQENSVNKNEGPNCVESTLRDSSKFKTNFVKKYKDGVLQTAKLDKKDKQCRLETLTCMRNKLDCEISNELDSEPPENKECSNKREILEISSHEILVTVKENTNIESTNEKNIKEYRTDISDKQNLTEIKSASDSVHARKKLRKTVDDIKKSQQSLCSDSEDDSMTHDYDAGDDFLGFDDNSISSSKSKMNTSDSSSSEVESNSAKPTGAKGGSLKNWSTTRKAISLTLKNNAKLQRLQKSEDTLLPKAPSKKYWNCKTKTSQEESDITDDTSPADDEEEEEETSIKSVIDSSKTVDKRYLLESESQTKKITSPLTKEPNTQVINITASSPVSCGKSITQTRLLMSDELEENNSISSSNISKHKESMPSKSFTESTHYVSCDENSECTASKRKKFKSNASKSSENILVEKDNSRHVMVSSTLTPPTPKKKDKKSDYAETQTALESINTVKTNSPMLVKASKRKSNSTKSFLEPKVCRSKSPQCFDDPNANDVKLNDKQSDNRLTDFNKTLPIKKQIVELEQHKTITNTSDNSKSLQADLNCNTSTPKPTMKRKGRPSAIPESENSFNPRLLLITKREQLDTHEVLTDAKPGTGIIQCGLCLKRTVQSKWREHLAEHYGVGWKQGEEKVNINKRSAVLATIINFLKDSEISSLNCRMCSKSYRSGLGVLSHIEGCGAMPQRRQCPNCQKEYSALSLPSHVRSCSVKLYSPTKVSDVVTEKVYSTTGRAKRVSTIKAENRLKEIEEEFISCSEDSNFNPHLYMKVIELLSDKLSVKWLRDIETKGKAVCFARSCQYSSNEVEILLQHHMKCKYTEKPGFYCILCKTRRFKSEVECIQHVIKFHSPGKDFSDDSDCNINTDDEQSSNDDDDGDISDEIDEESLKLDTSKNSKKSKKKADSKPSLNQSTNQIVRKKVFIKRVPNITETVKKKWKNFVTHNFTFTTVLLSNSMPRLSTMNCQDFMKYLPRQDISMKFSYKNKAELTTEIGLPEYGIEWTQIERFQTHTIKNEIFCFVGAPVTYCAWVPLPAHVEDQYLLVAYRKDMFKFTKFQNPKHFSTTLLLFKVMGGWEKNKIMPEICLHYSFLIDDGPVHHFDFLPSGGYSLSDNRLGLVAVASLLPTVKVYSLPIDIMQKYNEIGSFPLIKLCPSFELSIEIFSEAEKNQNHTLLNPQCLQVAWSEFSGHNHIFAGFSNGFMAIWDLTDDSQENLNRCDGGECISYAPLNYFFVREKGIKCFAVHYDLTGPRWIAVTCFYRRLVVFDILNMMEPLALKEDFNKNIICCIDWSPVWEPFMAGYGDSSPNYGRCVQCINPSNIMFSQQKLDNFASVVTSIHYSPRQNICVSGVDNGDVLFLDTRELYYEYTLERHFGERRLLSSMDVKRLDAQPITHLKGPTFKNTKRVKIEPTEQQEDVGDWLLYDPDYKEKYGLIFQPVIKITQALKTKYFGDGRRAPLNIVPLMRVNILKCNLNGNAKRLIAVGHENGFLRLIYFNRNKQFGKF